MTLLEQLKKHARAKEWDAALKLLRINPEELDQLRAENERLRTALEDLIEEHVVLCKHIGCKPKQPWYAAKTALSK